MPNYKIAEGECLDSIAFANGLTWEKVWGDSNNTDLGNKRKDAFVLKAGDVLFVPEIETRAESCATEKKHRFRRKGVPSMFRMQICIVGEPVANTPYRAVVDGVWIVGTTDSDGWVEFRISPDARTGELEVGEPNAPEPESGSEDDDTVSLGAVLSESRPSVLHFELNFGHLDPIDQIRGVQQRLETLGFATGEEGELDEDTQAGIASFQEEVELEPTGTLDPKTRDNLLKAYGC